MLASAMHYYTSLGYRQVEVPWMVGHEQCFATLPESEADVAFAVRDRYLVGSAEQGFLALDLPPGRYVSCSPCFRANPIDRLHQETFMKVELHITDNTTAPALDDMMEEVTAFYKQFTVPVIVATDDGYDINVYGIEVGSYGWRNWRGREWLYGTGLALPRFSIAQREK